MAFQKEVIVSEERIEGRPENELLVTRLYYWKPRVVAVVSAETVEPGEVFTSRTSMPFDNERVVIANGIARLGKSTIADAVNSLVNEPAKSALAAAKAKVIAKHVAGKVGA